MVNINFDYDERVVLETTDVMWVSRQYKKISRLVLTNKRLYCICEGKNGFFQKPTSEFFVFPLFDIRIVNGCAQIQQENYQGSLCLRIQFMQSVEAFAFSSAPKKTIPQWIKAINGLLGTIKEAPTTKSSKIGNLFSSAMSNIKAGFEDQPDAISQSFVQYTNSSNATSRYSDYQQPLQQDRQHQNPPKNTEERFCVNCGTKLFPNTKFCPECGVKVTINNDSTFQEQQTSSRTQRQQEYVGKIFKCPNCGNVVNQSDVICNSCGFRLSGKQANSSALDFQQKMMEIEMSRQNRKYGGYAYSEMLTLIKSYPIPNNIEDVVEFMHLAISNIDVNVSKNTWINKMDSDAWENQISNAWVAKMRSIYAKAQLYFPNEPEFVHIKELYVSMLKQLNMEQ